MAKRSPGSNDAAKKAGRARAVAVKPAAGKSPRRGSAQAADAPFYDTVAIVGVGLIGGSIGLALRKRGLARQVVGVGRPGPNLQAGLKRGAVTATVHELPHGVASAELIVVCTPVDKIVDTVRAVAEACPDRALITDVGSTKGSIVAALKKPFPRGVRFLGSHPLAGSELSGSRHAKADLFEGRTVVLTPTGANTPADRRELKRFWTALGARAVEMTPKEHDAAVATTSHVPHLVAVALAAATPHEMLHLVAGGWRDTTRVAAGDVEMWRQIFLHNRSDVLPALSKFEKVMQVLRDAIDKDESRLKDLLTEAKRKRDAVGS